MGVGVGAATATAAGTDVGREVGVGVGVGSVLRLTVTVARAVVDTLVTWPEPGSGVGVGGDVSTIWHGCASGTEAWARLRNSRGLAPIARHREQCYRDNNRDDWYQTFHSYVNRDRSYKSDHAAL